MSDKKILIDLKMIELGIAPESSGYKLNKMLKSLPANEQRKLRRKFRKIWRNICKEDPDTSISMGIGVRKPSRRHKRNRKAWVRRKISQKMFQE